MENSGRTDWVKELKAGAEKAAKLDAKERVDAVTAASQGIIERMAQEYELDRDLVDGLNVAVRLKLGAYVHSDERLSYNAGLAEAAVDGFRSVVEPIVGDQHTLRVLMRDYREELFEAVKP